MMKFTDQLAQYYRHTRQAEPKSWLLQHWLPQEEWRIRYLQWLLEPTGEAAPAVRKEPQS